MTDKGKKAILYAVMLLLSLADTIALAQISHFGITGIDFLLPCVFALCIIMFNKTVSVYNGTMKRDRIFSTVLALIASVCAVTGSHIDMEARVFNSLSVADFAYMLFLIPFFGSVFLLLVFSQDAITLKADDGVVTKKSLIRCFIICMAVMLVCWLPYYLSYFPGGIGNDDFECANMCLGNIPWTNHNPIFYIFLMNVCIKLTAPNITAAFAIMSTVQMLMFAATLSLTLCFMYRKGLRRCYIACSLGFFALHPFVAMYSIYVTKDVMFACVVIVLTLYLMDLVPTLFDENNRYGKSVKCWVVLGLLAAFSIITRNNGTVMMVILALAMLIALKKYRKQVFITFAVVLILNGIYKGPVWKALDIQKQSFAESAAIPLSQVAYTICMDGEITGKDREYLEKLMPFDKVKEEFEPGYTDSYKFSSSFDKAMLDDDPGSFMITWLHLLPRNFGDYVEAYLIQTCGYWHYGISNTVATEGVMSNDLGIVGHDFIEKLTGYSLQPLLSKLMLVGRKLPVLCLLSQMAIETLGLILLTFGLYRKDRKPLIMAFVPLMALWVSIMIATPAHCLFRYLCPVFFLWPVTVGAFYDKKGAANDKTDVE